MIAFLITALSGVLFLLGVLIIKKTTNKKIVYKFSSALAFSVIIGLLLFDIFPEIFENFHEMGLNKQIIYILSFVLMGVIILKILDCLIPAHNHHHHENNDNIQEHNNHLSHIGVITSIALIIHNIIEGLAIYTISLNSFKTGLLMCIGVGLHNIPMGMEISLTLDMANKGKSNKIFWYILLSVSPLLGSILINTFDINEIMIGIFLCLTSGMLIYILLCELLNEIKINIKTKPTILGLVIGSILMIFTLLL